VRACSHQERDYQRGEQPVHDKGEERQLEDIEPDVGAELRVDLAEVHPVPEQDPTVPLRGCTQPGADRKEQRHRQTHRTTVAAHDVLIAGQDLLFGPGRSKHRRQAISQKQVDPHEHKERDHKHHGEKDLGAQHPRPD